MTKVRHFCIAASCLLALTGFQAASAAIITSSLGNTASGLSDGDTPLLVTEFPNIAEVQDGQPVPFEQGCGGFFGLCEASWTFNYGAIADPIIAATIEIGMWGHDSSASGVQLSEFTVDGQDATDPLETLMEGSGGAFEEYNVYTVDLDSALFADLADGIAEVYFELGGPGLAFELAIGDGCGCITETAANGVNLIYSKLNIETRDSTIPPIPIPAAAPLFLSALALFGLYRRRVSRSQA